MNKERLLKLADLLEADAANPEGVKFDLNFWAADAQFSGKNYEERGVLKDQGMGFKEGEAIPVNCGTAACAVGLACISGAFADEGLTYKINHNGDLLPVFEDYEDWGAAEIFFDLTDEQSSKLFSPGSYSNRTGASAELEVAMRIRGLVDGTYVVYEPGDDDYDDDGYDDED